MDRSVCVGGEWGGGRFAEKEKKKKEKGMRGKGSGKTKVSAIKEEMLEVKSFLLITLY